MAFYNITTRELCLAAGEGIAETEVEAPAYRVGFLRVFGYDNKWQEPAISPITRGKGRITLHRAGLLQAAEAIIAQADVETRIWYEEQVWERSDPVVIQMGAALGLTPEQIDAMFMAA